MSTRNNEPAFYSETETLELERQDRWHATRDAALQGLIAGRGSAVDTWLMEPAKALAVAADYADRAHGPLEIVVPAGTTFDADALAKGGKLEPVIVGTHDVDTLAINALVGAARALTRQIAAEGGHGYPVHERADEVGRALKLFEGE